MQKVFKNILHNRWKIARNAEQALHFIPTPCWAGEFHKNGPTNTKIRSSMFALLWPDVCLMFAQFLSDVFLVKPRPPSGDPLQGAKHFFQEPAGAKVAGVKAADAKPKGHD